MARQPCGTTGGHAAHRAAGEIPCDTCQEAKRAYQREHSQRVRISRARLRTAVPTVPTFNNAACLQADPDLWFPEKGAQSGAAKQVCRHCPAINDCLAYALQFDLHGVWGGTSQRERHKIQDAAGMHPMGLWGDVA